LTPLEYRYRVDVSSSSIGHALLKFICTVNANWIKMFCFLLVFGVNVVLVHLTTGECAL